MTLDHEINVGLAVRGALPRPESSVVARLEGGPEVLLDWLETRLGLKLEHGPWVDRVKQYADVLEDHVGRTFSESFSADRWATSEGLLRRRDALLMAGWSGEASEQLPNLVRDLVLAEPSARDLVDPGLPQRLERVRKALEAGQVLPAHRVVLDEPVDEWPPAWRPVLAGLELDLAASEPDTSHFQGSIQYVTAESCLAACEAVAGALAADRALLSATAVLTSDDDTALALDGSLRRAGLPTMGARRATYALPVLQVLPLVLQLCWKPVDPGTVLDFVALSFGPIPRGAGTQLGRALSEQPGLGSAAWEEAVAGLTSEERDPEGEMRKRLALWFDHPRGERGGRLPRELVAERCGRVAHWAGARAAPLAKHGRGPEHLGALRALQHQAATLAELVRAQPDDLSEPQIGRLLEAARSGGLPFRPHGMLADGPILLRSLAELVLPVRRLVWLGVGADDPPFSLWTAGEVRALLSAGIEIDDGVAVLARRRRAERRGLGNVSDDLLVVKIPADEERRPHPIWQHVHETAFGGDDARAAGVTLRSLIEDPDAGALAPWSIPGRRVEIVPPPSRRRLWSAPAELLEEREISSHSSLEARLACPLKWTLAYQARVLPGPIARLPDDFLLRGRFCHDVLAEVLGREGIDPADPQPILDALARHFDERLPLDAATLLEPSDFGVRPADPLRAELLRATETLLGAIARGGYRFVGLEAEQVVDEAIAGRGLRAILDCLVEREDGEEGIIDFKYGGTTRYPALLAEGTATQLATYAAARRLSCGKEDTRVGYLLLADGSIHTPAGSPLRGALPSETVEDAPPIETTWRRFVAALERADTWIGGAEPIPARPLQPPEEWPEGVELALEAKPARDELHRTCRYCDFGLLCGREVLE